jgi:heme exporter protein B
MPLLLLPLLAPVLISATRGFEVALGREAGPGWPWAALLGIFAVVYLALGALLFRPLLEDT